MGRDREPFVEPDAALRTILEAITLADPAPIELVGLPGLGKSTLLKYIAMPGGALSRNSDWLQEPFRSHVWRLFPVYISFRLLPGRLHPFQFLYQRVYEEYLRYRETASTRSRRQLPAPRERRDVRHADLAIDELEDFVQTLSKDDLRPVLLLDDFDVAFAPQHLSRFEGRLARSHEHYI